MHDTPGIGTLDSSTEVLICLAINLLQGQDAAEQVTITAGIIFRRDTLATAAQC